MIKKALILVFLVIGIYSLNAQTDTSKHKTIGLCLSGGGALGYAHVGALQALEDAGIKPTMISGTSMGSIIGVLYAAGYSPAQMLAMIKEKGYRVKTVMDIRIDPKTGLVKHDQLRDILNTYIRYDNFDSLKIKLYVCCVDIRKGEAKIVSEGNNLKEFVVASATIPLVYEYCVIDGVEYIDGGIKNNFPVEPLVAAKCDKIIGINVINFTPTDSTIKTEDLAPNVYALMDEAINENRYKQCDYYIPIKGLNTYKFNLFSFNNYMKIYQLGYDNMKKYIAEHPEMLK